MKTTADVVIIGAGVIGSAVAYELTRRGYKTLNIDKHAMSGYGSTSASSANVRAYYSSRDGVAMAYEGFSYWENWSDYLETADEAGTARYVRCGSVQLKGDDPQYKKSKVHYDALGVIYEDWDLTTLGQQIPYYDLHAFGPPLRPSDDGFWHAPDRELLGAVYTPGAGYVNDPQLAAHNLQRAAEAKGGRFLFRRSVIAVPGDGRVAGVTLDDGEQVDCPVVVTVAGPHSIIVNRMAGVDKDMKITTRPLRHEVHIVPAPPGIDMAKQGFCTSDADLGIYFRPESGNTILVGGEDSPCDPQEWVDDPDTVERNVTREHWEAQVYRLARRIPTLQVPNQSRGVADLYDVSDDWIPVYDRSGRPGFYMAVGTSGNQFKNAPIAGQLMATLIDECENGRDHDRDPVQVTGRYSGLRINAGFFSRNRTPSADSSYSVNG